MARKCNHQTTLMRFRFAYVVTVYLEGNGETRMKLENGVLTLNQSDISAYMKCPEQMRLANEIEPGVETIDIDRDARMQTDAATLGTVFHAVIEHDLQKGFKNVLAAKKWARLALSELILGYVENGIDYRTESFGDDPERILIELDQLVESWFETNERNYWSNQTDLILEHTFDLPFLTNLTGRIKEVRLGGTPDVIDPTNNRVVDWKTASRPYQRWEYQRWAAQPTVYTFAAAQMGLIKPNADGLYRFDYRIFLKGKKNDVQEMSVLRGPGQWGWMAKVAHNIVAMMESDTKEWPLRDDGWWCSGKWCPVWNDCKGAFVEEDWT